MRGAPPCLPRVIVGGTIDVAIILIRQQKDKSFPVVVCVAAVL